MRSLGSLYTLSPTLLLPPSLYTARTCPISRPSLVPRLMVMMAFCAISGRPPRVAGDGEPRRRRQAVVLVDFLVGVDYVQGRDVAAPGQPGVAQVYRFVSQQFLGVRVHQCAPPAVDLLAFPMLRSESRRVHRVSRAEHHPIVAPAHDQGGGVEL